MPHYSISEDPQAATPIAAITDHVADAGFPCVGARSAFNKGRVRFGRYGRLGAGLDIPDLCADLQAFSAEFPEPGFEPVSFIALFDDERLDEEAFANRLWRELQKIHAHDTAAFDWDPTVSDDPAEPDFSFSVAGRAFFVVGLHPQASRIARRTPMPCLVFNFHDQFEALRATGKYGGLQKVIRQRDIALQGSINPVLAGFGDSSEARQYSGVPVGAAWQCPFQSLKTPEEVDA